MFDNLLVAYIFGSLCIQQWRRLRAIFAISKLRNFGAKCWLSVTSYDAE